MSQIRSLPLFGALLLVFLAYATPATAQCVDRTIAVPRVDALSLSKTNGDCEMKGHNPAIEIEATIRREGSYLVVAGTVTMTEDRPDTSTFKSAFSERVFVQELESPGCTYSGVDYESGTLSVNGGSNNHEWTSYDGQGFIKTAVCLSDTKGSDCGRLGCKISFEPITVRLTHN